MRPVYRKARGLYFPRLNLDTSATAMTGDVAVVVGYPPATLRGGRMLYRPLLTGAGPATAAIEARFQACIRPRALLISMDEMVGVTGIEPVTPTMST